MVLLAGDPSRPGDAADRLRALRELAGKEWIAGKLSIADFAVGSTFMYRKEANIPLSSAPHVAGWIERLEARPSWQKAVAPLQAFKG
jgi:glutathione S-transferase